ncbi:MAG: hypothetical protein V3U46_02455 [Acidimicrobiia bacterium]
MEFLSGGNQQKVSAFAAMEWIRAFMGNPSVAARTHGENSSWPDRLALDQASSTEFRHQRMLVIVSVESVDTEWAARTGSSM